MLPVLGIMRHDPIKYKTVFLNMRHGVESLKAICLPANQQARASDLNLAPSDSNHSSDISVDIKKSKLRVV